MCNESFATGPLSPDLQTSAVARVSMQNEGANSGLTTRRLERPSVQSVLVVWVSGPAASSAEMPSSQRSCPAMYSRVIAALARPIGAYLTRSTSLSLARCKAGRIACRSTSPYASTNRRSRAGRSGSDSKLASCSWTTGARGTKAQAAEARSSTGSTAWATSQSMNATGDSPSIDGVPRAEVAVGDDLTGPRRMQMEATFANTVRASAHRHERASPEVRSASSGSA
jgi:hypothetical protein